MNLFKQRQYRNSKSHVQVIMISVQETGLWSHSIYDTDESFGIPEWYLIRSHFWC